MDVHTWPYPPILIGMTSKQKLAAKIERQHAGALDRQRQRANQARRGSIRQQQDTNRIGVALCRAMLRSVEMHRQAQQSGST